MGAGASIPGSPLPAPHMTVPVYSGPNTSTANGVTTVFPYSFKVLAAEHLLVTVNGLPRTLGVHYTVSGVGNAAGGNITFMEPPPAGAKVDRRRAMPFIRLTDYQNLGDLLAATLNDDQDSPVLMIQQLADGTMQLVLDPGGTGEFVWDARGSRIIRVGDAIGEMDALNWRSGLALIEQVQGGGGTVGIVPKFWGWEGDGESTDFEIEGADVDDPLFYDTAMEATPGGGDYLVCRPNVDFTILPATAEAPAMIRFGVAPGEGVRGFTTLRGYARPWIGQTPIYTVAPQIITTITESTTIGSEFHNTLIVINSAERVVLTVKANTGAEDDWKDGQFFSTLQLGTGKVEIGAEDPGILLPPVDYINETRGEGCIISATCYAADADLWVSSGDLLRETSAPDLQCIRLEDRSVLIGSNISTGTGKAHIQMPFGMKLRPIAEGGLYASLATAQSAGNVLTVDVNRNGSSILSTTLTFDNGEKTTLTAATPAVFASGGDLLAEGDEITIDVDQLGTAAAKGLTVYLVGERA